MAGGGFRQVVIDSSCKLSYKCDYMIVHGENRTNIHLSEISTLLIANNMVLVTAMLLSELGKRKINVIFCDETHSPYGELALYYGHYSSAKRLQQQTQWTAKTKIAVSDIIIRQKIINQAKLLCKLGYIERSAMLMEYADIIELNDATNREGHAAKVYFNTLFGMEFTRDMASDYNSALNYGYSIVLSCISREIVAYGCATQLGIKHCNEYNKFNLSCDLMEPFRVIIDEYVVSQGNRNFDSAYKHDLVNMMNKQVVLDKTYYLSNGIAVVVQSILKALNNDNIDDIVLYCFDKDVEDYE